MRFLKTVSIILCGGMLLASCASEKKEETFTSRGRILKSESGYSLLVMRGEDKVEVIEPAELSGICFTFSETENYLLSGEMKIPLSDSAAAAYRDYLVAAYPEDYSGGEDTFGHMGASFQVRYEDDAICEVSVSRGGVTRNMAVEEFAG